MDVKSTLISYMTLNGTCFTVTWNIFRSHVLEVGLTQNQETVAFRMLLFYFIMCLDPHAYKFVEIAFG